MTVCISCSLDSVSVHPIYYRGAISSIRDVVTIFVFLVYDALVPLPGQHHEPILGGLQSSFSFQQLETVNIFHTRSHMVLYIPVDMYSEGSGENNCLLILPYMDLPPWISHTLINHTFLSYPL